MSIVWCYFLGPRRIALAAEEFWQHSVIREIASVPKQTVGKVYLSGRGGKAKFNIFNLLRGLPLVDDTQCKTRPA